MTYETIDGGAVPIKAWTKGVPVEDSAREQLVQVARLPFVGPHVAVMPDVHWGIGATVGSVIPTRGALVPAACGVDIGCGMCAVRTPLTSQDLGDNAQDIFDMLSSEIPHGRTKDGGEGDRGAWDDPPLDVRTSWAVLREIYDRDVGLERPRERAPRQLGTLGTGNHFVEVCLDLEDRVWLMLHSGSRGVGNAIGGHYIATAKRRCETDGVVLPNRDLAWLPEGTPEFDSYVRAVGWAQDYARRSREVMLARAINVLRATVGDVSQDWSSLSERAVNCHHNYVNREEHFGQTVWITRKGAVSARLGEMGIIPGSMGTRSFIVRGLGNPDSFHSCSHGAGRVMSRNAAKKQITLEQHVLDTAGVTCRKDAEVLDESPRAYKNVEDVMRAQSGLVEIVHELRGVVCVKG